ncbi:MAG TPA: aminotransferase class V-fold PLP-dependent enzyme [Cyclobacteriaceae bacterium]|nr:aminotransferase class V-fold PLP-dependent enzyme [Cyclobacteriaceae bacterium]
MLQNQRSAFSIPKDTTFLNCANLSPLAKSVEEIGIKALLRKRNPGLITADDFFTDADKLRKEYAKLINTTEDKRIVVIPSVSYGMANVVKNIPLKKGDEVIVAAEQFPSNYYPWAKRCEETGANIKTIAPPDAIQRRGEKWNEKILEAITPSVKVVALGNVHWADGTRFNLIAIRKRTREVGAALIIDGTQSVGALPFDIQEIQPDALICGGYKWLLGPYAIGLAYYGAMFDNGRPVEESWMNRMGSEDFRALVNYQSPYKSGSLRYEVGEHSNFVYVPMLMEAIRLLNKWKPSNIQKYCKSITSESISQLRENGYWIEDEDSRGYHLFGIRLPQHVDLDKVAARLRKNKVYVSFRGNAIRVAPNVYNTERDLEKLTSLLLSKK